MREEPVTMPTQSTMTSEPKVILGCAKCGASLPDEAQYCLKCGKPVAVPKTPAVAPPALPTEIKPPKNWRAIVGGILLALLAAFMLWAGMSDSTTAQEIQEFVGWKHDQVILDEQFSVGAHTFRYYKFSLPEGSVNVAVVGQFSSLAAVEASRNVAKATNKAADPDNGIEVLVITEPAFTVWQNGYATSSVYESGKVAQGTVQADVPAGAGIYYLIFNNKSSPKTPKNVHATVLLRYKSWLPEWFRRAKARTLDWIGA